MGINFKDFIKDIKGGLDVKGAARDIGGMIKSKRNLKKVQGNALDRVMSIYPSYTVVGEKLHAKRKKEFEKMINNGKVKEAIDLAKKYREQFKKDNPIYPG